MIIHQFLEKDGILILTPVSALEKSDFENLAKEVDPYLEQNGKLNGLLIDADKFPGWKDFASLIAHLKFVKDHHRKIKKIAVVSDSHFLSIIPNIASHFVQAEIKHFAQAQQKEARHWLISMAK